MRKYGIQKARSVVVSVADGWLRFWRLQDGELVHFSLCWSLNLKLKLNLKISCILLP